MPTFVLRYGAEDADMPGGAAPARFPFRGTLPTWEERADAQWFGAYSDHADLMGNVYHASYE